MDNNTKPETGSESWIYPSLIQTVRPIASLAAKLGILPYSYNIIYDRDFLNSHYNEGEHRKLIDVRKKAEKASIGFISLHTISQKDSEAKIDQMGMSKWRSDSWTGMVSVHCKVEQETAVSESAYPRLIAGDFMFGDTEAIAESDVGPWLDATFRSFQINQDITCLVGHDIRRTLRLVQPYWRVPSDVIILDTRAIWESQHQLADHPSLNQILRGVIDYRGDDSLLGNAGNTAQFILELIQPQVGRTEGKKNKDETRYMDMNMWRSPSW